MSAAVLMPTPVPAPSPLDNLHLSLSSALPQIRRQRRASSYTSPPPTAPTTPLIKSWEYEHSTAPSAQQSAQRPQTPRTNSSPSLPHARSSTDPSSRPFTYPHPGAPSGMRPSALRFHPLALAHINRIAESAELLMLHLQASLVKRAARSASASHSTSMEGVEGEAGALQLDLGPAREELVDIEFDRAAMLKGMAAFRAHVDNTKRVRHMGTAKKGAVHAAGPRRALTSGGRVAGGSWRARRGAVVSLGGKEGWMSGIKFSKFPDSVTSSPEMPAEEMDVEGLGERMGDIRLDG